MGSKFLCCDMSPGASGACVAQDSACAENVGVELSDVPDDFSCNSMGACALDSRVRHASFPSGTDGYAWWSTTTPAVGLCLVAPSSSDPAHAQATEPLGCIELSIAPGVGAAMARYTFPVDSRWDAYEICYGALLSARATENYAADGGPLPCADVNDLLDTTVTPTPVSHSCCASAEMLRPGDQGGSTWTIFIGQEIPGVPPNEVVLTADGGLRAYPEWDAGDSLGDVPGTCLRAYNEPANCGSPPPPGPTFGEGTMPPGDGGCITCETDGGLAAASSSADTGGKGCGCTAVGSSAAMTSSSIAFVLTLGVIAARARRRARR
jgi:hypothetical protein